MNGLLDACLENPCKNGGTCVDSGAGHRCLCLPTYGGDFCETGELPAYLIILLQFNTFHILLRYTFFYLMFILDEIIIFYMNKIYGSKFRSMILNEN